MNGITVTIKDKTKTASCKETVALCAQYALTVSPALEVDEAQTETVGGILTSTVKGYLVLHRRFVGHVPPDGEVKFIGGERVADQNFQWDLNEVYGYSELTTRKIDNVWVTTGILDLRLDGLCKDFIQKFGANANAPLRFAVYDPVAGGLAGEGEFDVKVVEPYCLTQNQSLVLFKGDKGDKGDTGDDGKDMTWDEMSSEDKAALIEAVVSDERTKGEKGDGLDWETMTAEDIAGLIDALAADGRFKGENGADGESAYELAVSKGFVGTLDEWLASLKGEIGDDGNAGPIGPDGKSAYEVAVAKGYSGTEEQWLASLKGAKGDKGEKGDKGDKGDTGAKGDKGDKGDKGEKGDKGDTGSPGTSVTVDDELSATSENPVQNKVIADAISPLQFAAWYPDGSVTSAADFTAGLKYGTPDTTNNTISVLPFCNTGVAENDNSGLAGTVVIPPYVDIDGERYTVVGVDGGVYSGSNENLVSVIAPTTVKSIGNSAFFFCYRLKAVSFPSVTSIGSSAFGRCFVGDTPYDNDYGPLSVEFPEATAIGDEAFASCFSIESASFPAATDVGETAFYSCGLKYLYLPAATALEVRALDHATGSSGNLITINFGDTPRSDVPQYGAYQIDASTVKLIIVPDSQYDDWVAASGWSGLVQNGVRFIRHSEWLYARKYELDMKADTSSLPYALTDVTPTPGAPFVLAACFPIKYVTRDETEVTVTAENAQTLSISGGYVVHDGLTIFSCNSNGTFAAEAEVDSVTFGDPATTPDSSTQVLGFTPTYALADRATNQVVIASPLPENGIALSFPDATAGKVRDFLVRLEIPAGDAPQIAYPEGVTFENADGSFPEIAADENAACATLLMFTETRAATTGAGATPACFLVKGEKLTAIAAGGAA